MEYNDFGGVRFVKLLTGTQRRQQPCWLLTRNLIHKNAELVYAGIFSRTRVLLPPLLLIHSVACVPPESEMSELMFLCIG